MLSSPLEFTHDRTTSGVACLYCLWTHIRSDDMRRGMPSSPLGSTHGRTMLGVTCHLRPLTAHMVGRCWAWQAIIALREHSWSDYVSHDKPSWPLSRTQDRMVSVVAMQSSIFECTHGQTTSYMTCYLHHFIAHTIGQLRAWPSYIAFW